RPAFTTDIIVGFPGETDEDFAATCQVAREVGFSKIHIFPFSARRTTPAATMPDQVSPEVKAARCRELALVEAELRDRYFASLNGSQLEVLVESSAERPGAVVGTSCRYASVELPGSAELVGQFVRVTAGRVEQGRIFAGENGC